MGCAASSQDAPPAIDPPPSAPPSAPRSSEQRATEQLPASFANEKPRASKSARYSDEDLWRASYAAEYGAAPAGRASAASMQTSAALDDGRDFKSGRQPTAWEKFARRASRKLSRKGVHAAVAVEAAATRRQRRRRGCRPRRAAMDASVLTQRAFGRGSRPIRGRWRKPRCGRRDLGQRRCPSG